MSGNEIILRNYVLKIVKDELPSYVDKYLSLTKLEENIRNGYDDLLNESTLKNIIDSFLDDLKERMTMTIGFEELIEQNFVHFKVRDINFQTSILKELV